MDLDACLDILKARHGCDHGDHEEHANHQATPCAVANVKQTLAHDLHLESSVPDDLYATTTRGLYDAFMRCQSKRVEIYARFETGFVELMFKDEFAVFSQEITKHFAAVSAEINRIEATLRARDATTLATLIRKVQVQEKEKLLLTSALLLERMRSKQTRDDDVSASIYETSIRSMEGTHTKIIEAINELLVEMQYEVAEL
ncbi:hypothetical protein SPRG_07005 [Saprolegnia parasitica CBS 223.65]|uniref:Uncharacterized protein n=1 Tax=Saprolegnia parasitica (strain CBS 223.65) TaxID=695850 RepID=A0A067CKU8_SAPPC|nr:hypothetical protein SPRG_07005 [Saprolegnia parasitica CBS 223.65]KDO27417.1 hypothetical protein SPRG_07005 [Saprolegnia parasitica CBS 223.65]|eukprot:XP_012201857.1 hypothetical protein SPRG_07005 [Saprolegnia parasitica CBS 223.65]